MLKYASSRTSCALCANTTFFVRKNPVFLGGHEYALLTCHRCGNTYQVDINLLTRKSQGAPVETT